MTAATPPKAAPNAKTGPDLSPLPLTPWLAGLAALTALATLRTLILPPWPQPTPLPSAAVIQAALERSGLRPSPAKGEPVDRNAERALSPELVWRLGDGQMLRLRQGALRRWESFQLAAITRNVPLLSLQDRYLADAGQDVPFAVGDVSGGRARQTCVVEGTTLPHPFGVTHEQLSGLLSQRLKPPREVLFTLLGLRPARTFGCVVISLQAPRGTEPSAATWQKVVSALTPILSRAQWQSPGL